MSFEEKYDDSIKFAEYAYNSKKYNIAVNRYYYGIYQKILNEIEKIGINIKYTSNEENTHNNTITIFKDSVLGKKMNGNDKFKKVIKFNNEISGLKKLRHKADYAPDNITEDEVKKAINKFNVLNSII